MKTRAVWILLVSTLTGLLAAPVLAEEAAGPFKTEKTKFYLAGYGGYTDPVNFAGRGTSSEFIGGVKLGFTPPPSITWFMWELDGSYTSTQLDPPAGAGAASVANMGVYTLAINTIFRYPGRFLQPYVGVGPIIAKADCYQCGGSDVSLGLGLLAGLRLAFGDHLMLFAEYKYNDTKFSWDNNYNGTWQLNGFVAGAGWNF